MNSRGQNIGYSAGDFASQAQMQKDELIMNQKTLSAQEAAEMASSGQDDSHSNYGNQASSFIHQKGEEVMNMAQGAGEQVKSMAHGAAEAVKNTLGGGARGGGGGDYSNANLTNPNNPSNRF